MTQPQALHSPIPPSSSARRAQCPRSSTLEALYPEEDSLEAAEGVAAHWAAAEQLQGRLVDVGQVAPNGVVLTEEMARGADMMSDEVERTLAPFGVKPSACQIETTIRIPRVHEQQFGSPDCFVVLPGQPLKLFLWDYKFGHRVVETFENLQLVEYAAGAVGHIPDLSPGVDIVATIVQPRSYHRDGPVRRWATALKDLRPLINIASNSAHEALGPNPRAKVGPECRDCKARRACPLLQAEGFAGMDEAKRIDPVDLDAPQAGLELRMLHRSLTLMKARISGLEQQLLDAGRRGQPTPGWRLTTGESRERWTVPAAQVAALGDLMRLDLRKPLDVLTPRQAREKGLDPTVVATLAQRTPGAVVLEPVDETAARKVFGTS
jgi:hypothetical protein